MNEAIQKILTKYDIRSIDDSIRALREVMQQIALLRLLFWGFGEANFLKGLLSMVVQRCVFFLD
jgi:hypothetical protein